MALYKLIMLTLIFFTSSEEYTLLISYQVADFYTLSPNAETAERLNWPVDDYMHAPDWSDRAGLLAYIIDFARVGLLDVASGETRAIALPSSDFGYHDVAWSADGQAFYLVEGITIEGETTTQLRLYSIDGSSNEIMLGPYRGREGIVLYRVHLSPDGEWIALEGLATEMGDYDIYLMPADCIPNCQPLPLTIQDDSGEREGTTMDSGQTAYVNWESATWSPDSQSLAFTCGDHICRINRDGTDYQVLLDIDAHEVRWSPDGSYLALLHRIEGSRNRVVSFYDLERGTLEIATDPERSANGIIWIPHSPIMRDDK